MLETNLSKGFSKEDLEEVRDEREYEYFTVTEYKLKKEIELEDPDRDINEALEITKSNSQEFWDTFEQVAGGENLYDAIRSSYDWTDNFTPGRTVASKLERFVEGVKLPEYLREDAEILVEEER